MDEESSYVFTLLDHAVFRGYHSKPTQESIQKWGLSSMRLERFLFDRPFNAMSPAEFLRDLVNSAEVRRAFPPIANAVRVSVVSEVRFTELRARLTCMDLFDRLTESGKVDSTGSIRKIIPDYIDGIEIADRVREVLVVEESEDYTLFSQDDRSEFLFKIFQHLVLGGGLCQYEDEITPYLSLAKELYKDLVAVAKDSTSEELRVLSRVYELQSNAVRPRQEMTVFAEEHRQNFLYVSVDPSYRHVNLWWHRYLSSTGFDVYIIRHGESTNNAVQGSDQAAYEAIRESDPGLSPNGLRQAEHLGSFMAANPEIKIAKGGFHTVFTSPMRRAAETASAVAKALQVNLEVWTDVFENKGCRMGGQSFPGDSRSSLQERLPGVILPETCTEEGWYLQPIETEEEAWARAQRVIDRFYAMSHDPEYQGKGVALVTHGNFMDYLFGRFVGRGEMKGSPRFLFSNTCYSRLHFKDPVPLLLYLDRNDHLAGLTTRYDSTMHESE